LEDSWSQRGGLALAATRNGS